MLLEILNQKPQIQSVYDIIQNNGQRRNSRPLDRKSNKRVKTKL